MKITREKLLIGFISAAMMSFAACGGSTSSNNGNNGGGTNNPPAAISVALSSPPTSVNAGQTAQFTATIANDSANAGVTWSCTPANSCGSFSPTKTASGAATTYTAPGTAGSVTVIATSVTDTTKTATATVTIAAAQQSGISIKVAGPSTVAANATGTFTATVTGDSSGKGVAWTCTPSGSCGSFSPTSGTGNSVTTTYTAPGTAGTVQIVATSQADGKTTGTASVTVGSASSSAASLQAGTYVFYLSGEDAAGESYGLAGEVALDGNGNVTQGEQDVNDAHTIISNEPSTPDQISTGTYTSGADGRGTLTLTTNDTSLDAGGTETFSIVVVNSKHALITELDNGGTATGSLDLQAANPVQPTGAFAFAVTGFSSHYSYSQGGVFQLDGSGNMTKLVTDFNEENGSVTVNQGTTSTTTPGDPTPPENVQDQTSSYTAPDAHGRGTAFFGGIYWTYYVVGPEVHRLLGYYTQQKSVGIDDMYIGSAYGQGTEASANSNAALSGAFAFTDASILPVGSGNLYYSAAGIMNFDGSAGNVSGYLDINQSGTSAFSPKATSQALSGATYTVTTTSNTNQNDTPADVTTVTGTALIKIPAGPQGITQLGLYLTDPNLNLLDPNNTTSGLGGALLVDLTPTNTGAGLLIPQGTVSTTAQAGNFAFNMQGFNAKGEQNATGQIVVGSATLTGTADINDLLNTGQTSAAALAGTSFTADQSNPGRFTVTVTTTLGGTPVTYSFVLYQIGSTGYVLVEVDATQTGIGTLQLQ